MNAPIPISRVTKPGRFARFEFGFVSTEETR